GTAARRSSCGWTSGRRGRSKPSPPWAPSKLPGHLPRCMPPASTRESGLPVLGRLGLILRLVLIEQDEQVVEAAVAREGRALHGDHLPLPFSPAEHARRPLRLADLHGDLLC